MSMAWSHCHKLGCGVCFQIPYVKAHRGMGNDHGNPVGILHASGSSVKEDFVGPGSFCCSGYVLPHPFGFMKCAKVRYLTEINSDHCSTPPLFNHMFLHSTAGGVARRNLGKPHFGTFGLSLVGHISAVYRHCCAELTYCPQSQGSNPGFL